MKNLWKFQSLYELQFFNCPACDYKDKSKQEFVDHACNVHPESINCLMNVSDIHDVVCPWNRIDIKEENVTENEIENVVEIDKNSIKKNVRLKCDKTYFEYEKTLVIKGSFTCYIKWQ